MGFARWQIAIVVTVTSLAAPLGILVWLLLVPVRSQAELVAAVSVCSVWMVALVLANWWEFTSVYLRWVWLVMLVPVAGVQVSTWSLWPRWGGPTWQLVLSLVVAAFGAFVIALSLGGRGNRGRSLPMAFPLAGGTYLVTDGGDGKRAPLTNYHYGFGAHRSSGVNASMRHATDIVAIGRLGGEARGYLPKHNSAFWIWGRPVLAPVDGEIVHVVDEVADNTAFGPNRPYGVGNHVVVRVDTDVYVVIGHLRQTSVECRVGQHVSAGEVLARVGNSGWTERPHVHIQAMRAANGNWWHGEPLPITFRGRVLVRNDTWRA